MKRLTSSVCLALLLSLSPFASLKGEDWLEFRGPSGQGLSAAKTLPTAWSESENIAWKVPIDGDGWSSPVESDDRIYLTTAVVNDPESEKSRSLRVICLNAEDGTQLWTTEVFDQRGDGVKMHKKNSHASATPVLDGDRLYVHFGPSGTACLSTEGELIWKTDALKFNPTHGNGGSPALYQGTLIITCDGADQQYVAGLSAQTGELKWKSERKAEVQKGFSFSTPTVIQVAGRAQAVCPGSGAVVSYDPETGEELWWVDYDEGYSVVPRPVFAKGLVYVCSGFNTASLYAIDPTGKGDVTESHVRWTINRGIPKTPSVLAHQDELYFVDDGGVASCVDLLTGDSHWKKRLGGKFSASVFSGGGNIYFQDENGKTTVVAPGTEYQELASNQIGEDERTFASFGVVGESLLLRSENHLYRITP